MTSLREWRPRCTRDQITSAQTGIVASRTHQENALAMTTAVSAEISACRLILKTVLITATTATRPTAMKQAQLTQALSVTSRVAAAPNRVEAMTMA
ncbi:hypothetical protein BG28_09035 [Nesterenkonia sp. AN1]|nr:hypothetical protein BG28_09035 [Nesterenkonia sp. AN1]